MCILQTYCPVLSDCALDTVSIDVFDTVLFGPVHVMLLFGANDVQLSWNDDPETTSTRPEGLVSPTNTKQSWSNELLSNLQLT